MSPLLRWLPIKERYDLSAVFYLAATTIRYQELNQRIYRRKVGCVVNLALMACGYKNASALQDRQMA